MFHHKWLFVGLKWKEMAQAFCQLFTCFFFFLPQTDKGQNVTEEHILNIDCIWLFRLWCSMKGRTEKPSLTSSVIYWHSCLYCFLMSFMRRPRTCCLWVLPSQFPTQLIRDFLSTKLCLSFVCATTLPLWMSVMLCQGFSNLDYSARINKVPAVTHFMMVVSCPCQSFREYSLNVNTAQL